MADLIDVLTRHGISIKTSGTNVGRNYVNICCPFCREHRFHCGIHLEKLVFKCFVCGEGGSWYKIREKMLNIYPSVNWYEVSNSNNTNYIIPSNTANIPAKKQFYNEKLSLSKGLEDWLYGEPTNLTNSYRSRCMDKSRIKDHKVYEGCGELSGYAVFVENDNIIARKYDQFIKGPKWFKEVKNSPFIFGASNAIKLEPETGIITEGIFDCLRFPTGTSVAVLGVLSNMEIMSSINKIFSKTTNLVIFFDRNVQSKINNELYFCLTDIGFNVKIIDWNLIQSQAKDVDELYIIEGYEYLYSIQGLESISKYSDISLI